MYGHFGVRPCTAKYRTCTGRTLTVHYAHYAIKEKKLEQKDSHFY